MSEKKPSSGKTKKTVLPTEKKPALKNKNEGPKTLTPLTQTNQPLNYLVVNSITGPQGPQGKEGPQGPAGIQGSAGQDGLKGSIGPIGPTGKDGTNGTNGTDGINGSIGPIGPTGKDGTNGTNGTDGINGSIGPVGPTGKDGTNGTNGTDGINGSIGPIGPTGKDGTNGTNGTDGINGSIGPIGPTGKDGTNGTNGTNGINGSIGPVGPTGKDGTNGTNGTNGINGSIGPVGPTGKDGTNGTNGINGSIGPIGPTGKDGTNGTNGINGSIGPIGPTGKDGTNGTNGINGSIGPIGPTGKDGTNGTNGINGSIGPQGPAGPGIEKDTIVLSRTNQSMSGYVPLNITVKGQPVDRGYWNQCSEMALMVDFPAVAADDQFIYLIGGIQKWTGGRPTNSVQRFEISTKVWKMQPYPISESLSSATAMIVGGKLMYAGGYVLAGVSKKSYMLEGNRWVERGDLNYGIAEAAGVGFKDTAYLFGGLAVMSTSPIPVPYAQRFTGNNWTKIKDAPVGFAMATAAVYKDNIYVFGGYTKIVNGVEQLMPVLRYNPATDVWDVAGYNPAGNVRGSAAMVDGTIYYAGGNNALATYIPSSDTFSYNVRSQKTEPMSSKLKIPRTNTSAVIMGKQMFVMGGTGYSGPAGTFYTEYVDLDPNENTFFLHKKS